MTQSPNVMRYAFVLVALSVCTLIFAFTLGIIPESSRLAIRERTQLCEAIAVAATVAADSNDTDLFRSTVNQMAVRHPELQIVQLEHSNTRAIERILLRADREEEPAARPSLMDSGDHTGPTSRGFATNLTMVSLPIKSHERLWGTLHLGLQPLTSTEARSVFVTTFRGVAFVAACSGLFFLGYLQRALPALHPVRPDSRSIRHTLNTFHEGSAVIDLAGTIVLANESLAQTLGLPSDGLEGRSISDFGWDVTDQEFPWMVAMREGRMKIGTFMSLENATAQHRTFLVNVSPMMDHDDLCQGAFCTFADVTEIAQRNAALRQMLKRLEHSRAQIREKEDQLRKLTTRDPLTNCLNRHAFFDAFDQLVRVAEVHESPVSCILLDIDQFTDINGKLGYAGGDGVLVRMARLLHEEMQDTAPICRYDGQSFCLAAANQDQTKAMHTARRIRDAVCHTDWGNERVTVSLGVATLSHFCQNRESLIQHSELALRQSKRIGANHVQHWDDIRVSSGRLANGEDNASLSLSNASTSVVRERAEWLWRMLASRDSAAASHSRRVAELATQAAARVVSPDVLQTLACAALLHEVTRLAQLVAVDEQFMDHAGICVVQNYGNNPNNAACRNDFEVGMEVIKGFLQCPAVENIVTTYALPFQPPKSRSTRTRTSPPVTSRLLRIADDFDAWTTAARNDEAISRADACRKLRDLAGSEYDPGMVERFIHSLELDGDPEHRPLDQAKRTEPPVFPSLSAEAGAFVDVDQPR
ncbi:MAG: diguanylate cyclase [Pirellulaceae bacterium]|nr:diguanylate cyclase [Planctomycetales bacterium]MCA9264298.1 diguanylate cyclase [Planctomycetales bacterium]